ncbi:MAG TPA: hypothetical protein VIP55_06270 [Agromyces sp.]
MHELRPVPAPRGTLSRWDVWQDGRRLGAIEERKLSGARLPFYEAYAPHPRTGKLISLELSTHRDERVQVVLRFATHPEEYRQHWS